MFWRKKPPSSDELFFYHSKDRRSSFRIAPPQGEPVWLRIRDRQVKVLNLGAGGISFREEGLRVGEKLDVSFALPESQAVIAATVEVIEINPPDTCHCRFQELSDQAVETIHKYMLKKQKEILQGQKQGRGGRSST